MRVLVALLFAVALFGDRCTLYIQDVRKAHFGVFGVDFPYAYGVAQLLQESGCRDILSYDGVGSDGLPQITYRIWQKPLKDAGVDDIKSVGNQLRAQAIIMHSLYSQKYGLWVAYQRYNGGDLVLREIHRAGVEEWAAAKAECRRGQSCFVMRGKKSCRSNCDINYEYSQNIFKYAGRYGSVESSKFRYR